MVNIWWHIPLSVKKVVLCMAAVHNLNYKEIWRLMQVRSVITCPSLRSLHRQIGNVVCKWDIDGHPQLLIHRAVQV